MSTLSLSDTGECLLCLSDIGECLLCLTQEIVYSDTGECLLCLSLTQESVYSVSLTQVQYLLGSDTGSLQLLLTYVHHCSHFTHTQDSTLTLAS